MAAVQRACPRAGGRPVDPDPGARQVLRDLLVQPRRVLHGPRGGPARPDRRGDREAAAGRAHPERDDRRHPPRRARARRAPVALPEPRPAPGARRARDPDRPLRRGRPQRAPEPRRALPAPDLPRPDAAGGRARASVPVHLEPLALARRDGARPRDRGEDLRAREGAEGDAAALRAGRRRAHVRAARGRDRREPGLAVPGDGDPGPATSSASPATPTSRSPTRPTTSCRPSRRSCAPGASARRCASRWARR